MQDRRQHYRVQADFANDVCIQLKLGEKTLNVRAKDLSAGGAGLLLPLTAGKGLNMGDMVYLSFKAPWCQSIRLKGKIIRKTIHEKTEMDIGLVFTAWEERRDSLGHRLRRIFNERRVLRVKTPLGESTTGMISLGTGETHRLEIEDIGVYGAMLTGRIGLHVDEDMAGTLTVDLGKGPVGLPCRVRHVLESTDIDVPYFGIYFYTLGTMAKHFEQLLIDYVFELQRDELRGPQKTTSG